MNLTMLIQVVLNGLLLGSIYSLISIGLTLIFGVMKIINFAHGEFLMLGMYFFYWMYTLFKIPFPALLVMTPLFLFVVGIFIQKILINPVLEAPEINQLLLTAGLLTSMQNLAIMLWTSNYRSVNLPFEKPIHLGFISISSLRLMSCVVSLITSLVFFIILKRTDIGRAIRATAQSRKAALLMGINVNRIYILTFGVGSALVGIAAALITPIYWVFPTVGTYFGLIAFVVVTLGGLGSVEGAFFGGLIIGISEALAGALIGAEYQQVFAFVIFILILLFKPEGLFGRSVRAGVAGR